MSAITLIFPHQLFEKHPALRSGNEVYLVADELFFTQYPFHRQKLALHVLSMEAYANELTQKGYRVYSIATSHESPTLQHLFSQLHDKGITEVHLVDPDDYLLNRRLQRFLKQFSLQAVYYESPNFIFSLKEGNAYFDRNPRYLLQSFYMEMRRKTGILVEDGKPVGGKWSFDEDNRKKLPAKIQLPQVPDWNEPALRPSQLETLNRSFTLGSGALDEFRYPLTTVAAKRNLEHFLEFRFQHYGTYQDAIHREQSTLFHTLLTPALNIGLLDPRETLTTILDFARQEKIEINQSEGLIRQILGWREFIRMVYRREGVKQRTRNFWGFSHPMPAAFWTGDTGILPVDTVIKRLLKTGYSNHIERLMILGNFMCLCEIAPDAVYEWFMSLYIDAYDWVMVPNVYGMSQFADGGLMSTKPYISGSNYVLKMSHYPKGEWCHIWDALFWRFMHVHRDFFQQQPRLAMLLGTLDRMPAEKLQGYLSTDGQFLTKLHSQ